MLEIRRPREDGDRMGTETTVRVGVTGHMNLSDETVPLVAEALRDYLGTFDTASLVGISCPARGADTVFAEVVIELGGRLEQGYSRAETSS
jgi:hypothetical protein